MNWLLDTCVLSEYVSKNPVPGVIGWLDALCQFAVHFDDAARDGPRERAVARRPRHLMKILSRSG